jgi:hypothetical protein
VWGAWGVQNSPSLVFEPDELRDGRSGSHPPVCHCFLLVSAAQKSSCHCHSCTHLLARARHISRYISRTTLRPVDCLTRSDFANVMLIQHFFVLDQISPVASNIIRILLLNMDNAAPDALTSRGGWLYAVIF